jgi:hypothetical protein
MNGIVENTIRIMKGAGNHKKLLPGLMFFCTGIIPAKANAFQYRRHGIKATMIEEQNRIYKGFVNGSLSRKDFARLEFQQAHIAHNLKAAKDEGIFTHGERFEIRREQARASRNIYRRKNKHRKQ